MDRALALLAFFLFLSAPTQAVDTLKNNSFNEVVTDDLDLNQAIAGNGDLAKHILSGTHTFGVAPFSPLVSGDLSAADLQDDFVLLVPPGTGLKAISVAESGVQVTLRHLSLRNNTILDSPFFHTFPEALVPDEGFFFIIEITSPVAQDQTVPYQATFDFQLDSSPPPIYIEAIDGQFSQDPSDNRFFGEREGQTLILGSMNADNSLDRIQFTAFDPIFRISGSTIGGFNFGFALPPRPDGALVLPYFLQAGAIFFDQLSLGTNPIGSGTFEMEFTPRSPDTNILYGMIIETFPPLPDDAVTSYNEFDDGPIPSEVPMRLGGAEGKHGILGLFNDGTKKEMLFEVGPNQQIDNLQIVATDGLNLTILEQPTCDPCVQILESLDDIPSRGEKTLIDLGLGAGEYIIRLENLPDSSRPNAFLLVIEVGEDNTSPPDFITEPDLPTLQLLVEARVGARLVSTPLRTRAGRTISLQVSSFTMADSSDLLSVDPADVILLVPTRLGTLTASDRIELTQTAEVSELILVDALGVSAEFRVITTSGPIETIRVEPTEVSLAPGESITFSAKAFDQFSNQILGGGFGWHTVGGMGTIDERRGIFTAGNSPGVGFVIAASRNNLTFGNTQVDLDGAGKVRVVAATPAQTTLYPSAPNPFNPETQLSYDLKEAGAVQLKIYNLAGQQIRSLVETHQLAGHYQVSWDGKDQDGRPMGSGTYIARFNAGNQVFSQKMLLVR